MTAYKKIGSFKTILELGEHFLEAGISIPFDSEIQSGPEAPLAQPISVDGFLIGNRFAILPMEGWDGTPDGHPSELTYRRWQRFGASGAKLIWGGEAAAVRHDGRANPNQLIISRQTLPHLSRLRQGLVENHRAACGTTDDLLIGLQLTHSGRWSRPNRKDLLESTLAYDHPFLNPRSGLPPVSGRVISDEGVEELVADFVQAACLAQEAGFDFVDVKHCHGYLGHEFLSAVERAGKYGGSFENRTRFGREIITGIQSAAPGLKIGVRLSAFDFMPFHSGPDGTGVPDLNNGQDYPYAFGGDGSGLGINLAEPIAFLKQLLTLGVHMACITAGSPYYNPHIQRPAYTPPSDGYLPPENPLLGVARQVLATAQLKAAVPQMVLVGSAYSCLQDWLPNVAQGVVRQGTADLVGLGRMILAYPQFPADVLAGRPLQRSRICRTFSDCTTAPRNGMVSGCYPLDEFYKSRPEQIKLQALKKKG
jgi:NADPH2 dehydrogenase